ncbi:MAG: rod-binding protein, partial [Gammaproteobacteria bacterium]
MDTPAAGGFVDFSRFATLREGARADGRAALAKVADEFEALMVELMLKSARDASGGDGLFDSDSTRTYREMLDQQLAHSLAARSDFGIGRALERQFGALLGSDDATVAQARAAAEGERAARAGALAAPTALPAQRTFGAGVTAQRGQRSGCGERAGARRALALGGRPGLRDGGVVAAEQGA